MKNKNRRSAKHGGVIERLIRVARDYAGGDSIVEEIVLCNLHYNWGKGHNPHTPHIDSPTEVGGVKFWCVGHNASHEFYLGTDGHGRKFVRAVGESLSLDWEGNPLVYDEETGFPTETPGLDESVSEVAEFGGYLGHF